jgi:hypothetical protein
MIYSTMMNKKYTLAIFENCSKRFLGKNVSIVYLVVRIAFRVNLLSCVFTSFDLNCHTSSYWCSFLASALGGPPRSVKRSSCLYC